MNMAKRALALIGITVALGFPAAGVAVAGEACTYPATCTPNSVPVGDVEATSVTKSTDPATSGATLPVTGGDIVGLTLLGGGAFAFGTVLVRRTRRA